MDKIEPNEYIRTIRGEIGIFDRYSLRKETSLYKSPFDHFIRLQGRKTPLQCDKQYIVKHSKNIIDLIEVGDFVNGNKVYKVTNACIYCIGKAVQNKLTVNIQTILTHEQYENNCYRIGE